SLFCDLHEGLLWRNTSRVKPIPKLSGGKAISQLAQEALDEFVRVTLGHAVTRGKLPRRTHARERVRKIKTRARFEHRRLRLISRTATLGGLFLSFLKIGVSGF